MRRWRRVLAKARIDPHDFLPWRATCLASRYASTMQRCQSLLWRLRRRRHDALTRYRNALLASTRPLAVRRLTDLIESFLELKRFNAVAGVLQVHDGTMTCSHPGCKPSAIEVLACDVVANILRDEEIDRLCAMGSREPMPDFASRRHVVEVKELASQSLRAYEAAHDRHLGYGQHYPVESLHNVWGVWTDVTPAMGSFDQANTPEARKLIRPLTRLLEQLEAEGISDINENWRSREAAVSLIGFGSCCVYPPGGPYPPGILMIGHASGYRRTTDPERDVVALLQEWLDSRHADNLKRSLMNADAVRVAALVASTDGPAHALISTLAESPEAGLLTPLQLPDEIDAVVVIAGPEVLDYGIVEGWRRTPIR